MRYVGPGSASKHLTAAEARALAASGLRLVSLAEGARDDPLDGYGRGVEHARSARDGHLAAGGTVDAPIYFAVDFDATAAQLSTVGAYLDGAAAVLGRARVGVYGGYRTIAWVVSH